MAPGYNGAGCGIVDGGEADPALGPGIPRISRAAAPARPREHCPFSREAVTAEEARDPASSKADAAHGEGGL